MKKRFLALILVATVAFGMTGCGNANTQATADTAAEAETTEAETTEAKDSVIVAIDSEPETLDPTRGWGHGNSPIVQSTLVKYKADLTFENDLATAYELSDDALTWTFTIRDDAYFSDGEKVTAEDVAFTLETAKAAQGSIDLTYMDSAVAVDDTTVVITLSQPTSIFLNTLAGFFCGASFLIYPIFKGPITSSIFIYP